MKPCCNERREFHLTLCKIAAIMDGTNKKEATEREKAVADLLNDLMIGGWYCDDDNEEVYLHL
jgi:hypothetical protein